MPVEHARNLFKLSEALEQTSTALQPPQEAEKLRKEAEALLREKHPEVHAANRDEDYDKFIPIFWR